MSKDLILKFQFTDRAGRSVFNIQADNRLPANTTTGPIPVQGQMRLKLGVDTRASSTVWIDWNADPEETDSPVGDTPDPSQGPREFNVLRGPTQEKENEG
jgi:hypothetical protein